MVRPDISILKAKFIEGCESSAFEFRMEPRDLIV
jgi:hypothetical protein